MVAVAILSLRQHGRHMPSELACRFLSAFGAYFIGGFVWACVSFLAPTFPPKAGAAKRTRRDAVDPGQVDVVHWFDPTFACSETRHRHPGAVCKGCEKFVRQEQMRVHGLPAPQTKIRMDDEEQKDLLVEAAKKGVYSFATPFHAGSQTLLDLVADYSSWETVSSSGGSFVSPETRVRSAIATVASRIKLCGDIYQLRCERKLGIRMSLTRDSDRYTALLRAELDRWLSDVLVKLRCSSVVTRPAMLRGLFFQIYLLRGFLSLNMRSAMQLQRTPFLPLDLFTMDLNSILWQVCEYCIAILSATHFTPFSPVLQPYSQWMDRGILWSPSRENVAALDEYLLLAVTFATWPESALLSPVKFESFMITVPGFQSFRSKEVWLDGFDCLIRHRGAFALSDDDVVQIRLEMDSVGERGPGPRRLLRWCAGAAATKDPLRVAESENYKDVGDALFTHLQERFDLRGRVQTYFVECEVSKGVHDLYTAKGIVYRPFVSGADDLAAETARNGMDAEMNSPGLLRSKFIQCVVRCRFKYSDKYAIRWVLAALQRRAQPRVLLDGVELPVSTSAQKRSRAGLIGAAVAAVQGAARSLKRRLTGSDSELPGNNTSAQSGL